MKTIIIEKGTPGGLIAKTDEIMEIRGTENTIKYSIKGRGYLFDR